MIAALDVYYVRKDIAVAAALAFKHFTDTEPVSRYTASVNQFGEYILTL
jgi:deoxyinosine 3'endonuclease (endonuclease V)